MNNPLDRRKQELAQLQLQLSNASQLLDEIEGRSRSRCAVSGFIDQPSSLTTDNPEHRFAACVASGMSKVHALG